MFTHAFSFNQPLNNWNVSKVEDMAVMFENARDYLNGGASKQRVVTQYGDISNWNVSNVTNMSEMFYRAESFNQPLNWNVTCPM